MYINIAIVPNPLQYSGVCKGPRVRRILYFKKHACLACKGLHTQIDAEKKCCLCPPNICWVELIWDEYA